MKQRLLLVLLALFTSIGWMNARVTLTIPKDATGTLTFTYGNALNINETPVSGNSFKVDDIGKAGGTIIIDGNLKTLNVNTKVTEVKVENASELTSLVFSNTAGSTITKIEFTGTNGLTTLTADNCGLKTVPDLKNAFSSTAKTVTVNLQNNKITTATATNLVDKEGYTYKFGGNKIEKWPALQNATIDYGSQEVTINATAIANKWFDVWTSVSKYYNDDSNSKTKIENASQLNYAWRKGTTGSYSSSLIKDNTDTYPGNFQFYSNGEYQSGIYQCQVSPKTAGNGPTYVVTVDVAPAEFTLKISASPAEGGTLTVGNGSSKVENNGTIKKGNQLTFSAQAAAGYAFSKYEVVGLTKVSDNVYRVDGHGEDKELKVLNNIDVPLFMRWGNVNEMIVQMPEELVDLMNNCITNPNKDIYYIDGANHSYEGKEEELAKEIIAFIKKNK